MQLTCIIRSSQLCMILQKGLFYNEAIRQTRDDNEEIGGERQDQNQIPREAKTESQRRRQPLNYITVKPLTMIKTT